MIRWGVYSLGNQTKEKEMGDRLDNFKLIEEL
jgi:hypothetical protein